MELTKENLDFIHENLLERIDDLQKIILEQDLMPDEKLNKYTKISSYFFISAAIESLTISIIDKKYANDSFSYTFMHNKMNYSGAFLEYELIEKLLNNYDFNSIAIIDFTTVFYPVCKNKLNKALIEPETQLFLKMNHLKTFIKL